MKKIWRKIKNLCKKIWEKIKEIAQLIWQMTQKAAKWIVDHPEQAMIISSGVSLAYNGAGFIIRKIRKSQVEREIDYQRKHIYDYSVGHHWTLRRELTSNEMRELSRRKADGEMLADILDSMRVLA